MPKETREEKENTFGPQEIGVRNVRRKTLSVFASELDLVITNTFYELRDRRLTIHLDFFQRPRRRPYHLKPDYILINRRYRNSFTGVPGCRHSWTTIHLSENIGQNLRLYIKQNHQNIILGNIRTTQ